MNTAKDYIHKLIDELSEKELPEVLDYIKSKKLKENYQDLQDASQSSMSFWENQINDEVWNNI
ncbi:DUF2281 domain-containing protein [Fusibacter ferrireducens]|uniref:DUF2281 domain-containing protein n=1 Tax=Fusibacter ferrireducens TaxID=2785058 RepID=A0ABR9ZM22_9FIRM|nr:DUF2281 domain-containing protein [Fusibacter ferrireducens]MBF4691513.1 DUF2281 domain-containing protein [Fusibacter ferrireducens]